jgi:hypothetical protein
MDNVKSMEIPDQAEIAGFIACRIEAASSFLLETG